MIKNIIFLIISKLAVAQCSKISKNCNLTDRAKILRYDRTRTEVVFLVTENRPRPF